MRKKHRKNWTKRTKRKFLLLPRTINHETRWLEWATWEDEYWVSKGSIIGWWEAKRWID